MITPIQYFGSKKFTPQHEKNALALLRSANALLYDAATDGAYGHWIDADTNSQISGARGGDGDGGYRLPFSTTGLKLSSHKEANGIDIFDPNRVLAAWCLANQDTLAKHGLYMEDPRWTPGWVHLQRVPPRSGKRVYIPSTTPPLAPALPNQKAVPFIVRA